LRSFSKTDHAKCMYEDRVNLHDMVEGQQVIGWAPISRLDMATYTHLRVYSLGLRTRIFRPLRSVMNDLER
jgi:hypothetical protein